MDEIIQEVTELLTVAGGSMVYKPLYEAVSQKAQRRLYPALRLMRQAKQVVLANPIDPDSKRAVFTITLTSGGDS